MYQRRYRARRRTSRTYSLAHLLARQPKTLARHKDYPALIASFTSSDQLSHLRISRRCYTLLNEARVSPENLVHFFRTYRLPRHSFFPLFFQIKRDYLADRVRVKEERRQYILSRMRDLPPEQLAVIKYLGHLERHYNAAGESPLWQRRVFPTSKKQANTYTRFSDDEWQRFYRVHLQALIARYPRFRREIGDRVFACLVLGLIPASIPPPVPDQREIAQWYRRQSLRHHPDRGGRADQFIAIKRARDSLLAQKK